MTFLNIYTFRLIFVSFILPLESRLGLKVSKDLTGNNNGIFCTLDLLFKSSLACLHVPCGFFRLFWSLLCLFRACM